MRSPPTDSLWQRFQKRGLPSLLLWLDRQAMPSKVSALLRRLAGGRARIDLYFAFDDPYAAVALPGLIEMIRDRPVRLNLYPLARRGLAMDPAAAQRRVHAVRDSAALLRRQGQSLRRVSPLAAAEVCYLAEWTLYAQLQGQDPVAFADRALRRLWRDAADPADHVAFRRLYAECYPGLPLPDHCLRDRLDAHHRALQQRGHWDSPAAWVEGRWYFAHERLPAITDWLRRLAWLP
ncbi:MAG: hypothetical protein Q8Q73_05750 [Stagnimonas sp.]|nr:hypothetical protein [Stagnimonas sp.]